ncbi:MAG TPA: HAD family hydrolase [Thermomicrobiaceae bacterium]|nr:HAD family hydrolase [Thermomicrobiaceae bacterium]
MVRAERTGAILFDWDDTLCGAVPHRYETIEGVLSSYGERVDRLALHRAWVIADDPVVDRAASGFWGRLERELRLESRPEVVEAVRVEFTRREDTLRFELFADAVTLLDRLSEAGWRTGVVSNNVRAAERVIELGLAERFDVVVTPRDAAGIGKPDPAIFRVALERLGTPAERTFYIGDTFETDVLGARAAGLRPLLVDRLGVAGAQADDACAVLASLADVLHWLPG